MSFFEELKRRNVFRVGLAYVLLSWALLQGADFTLDLVGAPDWVIRALAVVVAIGLPIALFFAWAFELTPEGIKRESEVDRSDSVTPHTGRKLDRVIIGLLALVVGWFLLDEFYLEPRETAQPVNARQAAPGTPDGAVATTRSVAVLPFRNMSSGADDGFFADGLTEEILNSLAQVPELAVTSRTSAFYFKDQDLPIRDIAEQLGVEHVVEGSVRRSGDRLRVTAQLIRASDDTHLWSETYDRSDADAIAVQEEIAERIAETLGVYLDDYTLALMRSAGLRDVTAFIEYQKGRDLHEQAHGHEVIMPLLAEGNEHIEAALAVQPNFRTAWLFFSDYYTHLLLDHANQEGDNQLSEEEIAEAYEAGRNAFQRAARGSGNPNARAASELDLAIYEGNGRAWRPLLEQLLESESCDDIIWHQLIAFVPDYAIRFAKATERLRDCDPMTTRYTGMILSGYVWGGEPADGLAVPNLESAGLHPFYVTWKTRAYIALGRFDEAITTASIDSATERARQQGLMLVAAAQGDAEEARRIDEEILSGDDNHFFALQRAAWLGDRDRANELAAAVDGEALGHLSLMMATYWCACGSPFDIEATPNFAAIWQAAELPWPLESPLELPLKDW
jgi:adenylate cyclase